MTDPIRITTSDLQRPEINDYVEMQKYLQRDVGEIGRQPWLIRVIYANWFYLSIAAALGGLDALVFTAGIGENDEKTRAEVAAGCAWLGLELDEPANLRGDLTISTAGSRIAVFVIPTNEELEIARSVMRLMSDR